ncbi:DUF4810 domain-containing protein [Nitrincola sp. MINF-07-Sa-05]|uniref:DUF4810 domain-containing protein n=1 Tax=Nitrincola salilacus TaxID=3400273 RepID=UPI00391862A1
MTQITKSCGRFAALLLLLFLVGCAGNRPQTLYSWGEYQTVIYNMDTEDPGQQIDQLNENIIKANAEDRYVPPGMHAHLGMLYSHSGQDVLAVEHFEIEKNLFPEATTFMDLLISELVRDGNNE